MEIKQYSENALTINIGDAIDPENNHRLSVLKQAIEDLKIDEITEIVIAYTSLIIYFDFLKITAQDIQKEVEAIQLDKLLTKGRHYRVVEIPVCYGENFGPDIATFKESNDLSEEEVIQLHANKPYLVYMVGFMPGFPYLGGLDPKLHKARLDVPRTQIPAGSVGIGGQQTGMYPFASPGGWNLIGRTPIHIYDPRRGDQAILYQPGDYIEFKAIDEATFYEIEKQAQEGTYEVTIRQGGDSHDA